LSGFLTWLFTTKILLIPFKELINQTLNPSSTQIFLTGAIFLSSFALLAMLSGFTMIIIRKSKKG